jgi:hypothetical protein
MLQAASGGRRGSSARSGQPALVSVGGCAFFQLDGSSCASSRLRTPPCPDRRPPSSVRRWAFHMIHTYLRYVCKQYKGRRRTPWREKSRPPSRTPPPTSAAAAGGFRFHGHQERHFHHFWLGNYRWNAHLFPKTLQAISGFATLVLTILRWCRVTATLGHPVPPP